MRKSQPRILTIGNASVVTTLRAQSVPMAGETVFGDRFAIRPGGRGVITAVSLSKLGCDSLLCASLGEDSFGNIVAATCAQNGIDTRFLSTKKRLHTSSVTMIKANLTAPATVVIPGAGDYLDEDDIENAFISKPDAVLIQCNIEEHLIYLAAEFAHNQNIPIILDTTESRYAPNGKKLGKIDILLCDEGSCALMTDIRPTGEQNCVRAIIELERSIRARYTVIKLGAKRGAFLSNGKYHEIITAFDTITTDTAAASESYTAALICDYLVGLNHGVNDISHACTFAALCEAWTVNKSGALVSLPYKSDIENFVNKNDINFDFYRD